jgi:hypothetical protein
MKGIFTGLSLIYFEYILLNCKLKKHKTNKKYEYFFISKVLEAAPRLHHFKRNVHIKAGYKNMKYSLK